jgi:uncharacterized membrane protein
MAFCSACGSDVGGAAFCPKCGAAQGAAAAAPAPAPAGGASVAPATSGLEENVAGTLCYLPFVGWIIALVFFLIDKRPFVKFHAAQSLTLAVGLIIFYVGLSIAMIMLHMMHIFFLGLLIYPLLWLLIIVTLIFMMYKAYQHEKFKLPVIGDFAENLAGK